jgi:hypothetical protein
MQRSYWLSLCFFLMLACKTTEVDAAPGAAWSPLEKRKDIEIFSRTLSGDKEPEIKGVGQLAVAPEKAFALITDVSRYAKLLSHLKKADVLKSGTQESFVYFYFDLPWPLTDCDYVVHYQWETKDKGYIIKWRDANHLKAETKGVIRIKEVRGSWLLEPTKDGKTLATYTFLAEYSGSVPNWMKKDAQTGEVKELFAALRKVL